MSDQPIRRTEKGHWAKGQSGNMTGGRRGPQRSTVSAQQLKQSLIDVLNEKVDGDGGKVTRLQAALRVLYATDPAEFCRLAVKLVPKNVDQAVSVDVNHSWADVLGHARRIVSQTRVIEGEVIEADAQGVRLLGVDNEHGSDITRGHDGRGGVADSLQAEADGVDQAGVRYDAD